MREIKFRAWDTQINKYRSRGTIHISGDGSAFMLTSGDCGEMAYQHLDDLILEQYTGLKDKNGKEIYEGDIIRYNLQDHNGTDHFYHGVIECAGAEFGCSGESDYTYWHTLNDIANSDEEISVIGNIHENPDLLNA
jgi:uncharacterized phage protein (TIGR01671 family)